MARRPAVQELAVEAECRASRGWPSSWALALPASPPLPCLAALKAEGLSMQASLPAIARHTALTRLELPICGLQSLPAPLGALTALRCLDLSSNWDVQGWEHLVSLAALTKLNMDYCGLAPLPQQHSLLAGASFTGLHSLALGQDIPEEVLGDEEPTPSDTLPTELLLRYTRLTHLDLTGCGLTSLPNELSSLPALSSLSFAGCRLADASWERLPIRLTSLALIECRLGKLPTQLSLLTGLQTLALRRNSIGSWGPITALTGLTSLHLGNSGSYTALPHQLSTLHQLREVEVSFCRFLTSGLYHLSGCTQLTRLHADYCPDVALGELSALSALCALSLQGCDFSSAGRAAALGALSGLHHLVSLNIHDAHIEEVPAAVSALTGLTCLDISYTGSSSGPLYGWKHLMPLRQLVSLDLTSCGLTCIPPHLRALTALQQLRLDRNPALAASPHPGWHLLEPLSRLTFLSLLYCGVAAPLAELRAVLGHARVCTYTC
ncbi:hypothetical protein ABPG75_012909 [Micractinium tetrahymenae]